MLSQSQILQLEPRAKNLMIISIGMISGVIMLAFVLLALGMKNANTDLGILTLVGSAAMFGSIAMAFFVPTLVARAGANAAQQLEKASEGGSDPRVDALGQAFMTKSIIRYALLEGGCFLNLIIFLVDNSWYALIPAAFGVIVMLLTFPLPGKMHDFVAEELRT